MTPTLSPDVANRFARIALGHVEREYPNKPGHVLTGPDDARPPGVLHPLFYGSFDWHSCVHSYWLLARVLRLFPGGAEATAIAALFDRQLVATKVAGECAYFAAPTARGYERPYGWAWLLKLAAALVGTPWAGALTPLATIIVERFRAFLPLAAYPVRAGTHGNTAFALLMAAGGGDEALDALLAGTAERWYGGDTSCPAWDEPGGDDFLSPALIEAACMQRLRRVGFIDWFDRFLPRLLERQPAVLFRPVLPSDRSDGKIAHLDGLNLSRAWCLRRLAAALPLADPRSPVLREAAGAHIACSLPHLETHYMGEHWLATYALLALDESEY